MKKEFFIICLVVVVAAGAVFAYKSMSVTKPATPVSTQPAENSPSPVLLSPVFSKLPTWVPETTWSTPKASIEKTDYGELQGMAVEGEIKGTGTGTTGKRNLKDQPFMQELGFTEDIKFMADGPGASNWGYKKTENGKMQIVIFRYSSNRLLGPESTAAPFLNLSVFVSDPFTIK